MKPPNIILCMADQLRPFELGCYGHPVVRTPNIDAMAEGGVTFETACSDSPLCVPARHVLITGQYARECMGTNSNYVSFPPSSVRDRCVDTTLAEALRNAGYKTGVIGKWHVYPAPGLIGFDDAVIPHNLHRHYGQSFYDISNRKTVVEGFSLDYEHEQVRRFISGNRDRPFFLQYNFSPPHSPLCDAPREYLDMYSREDVVLRDNVFIDGKPAYDRKSIINYAWDYLGYLEENLEGHEAVMSLDYEKRNRERPAHGLKRVYRDVYRLLDHPVAGPVLKKEMPYLDTKALEKLDVTDMYRFYYGMVTCIDDYIGKMLECLKQEGLFENTLVIFTSDHGDNLGSHHLWRKSHVYEEALRIPMIFSRPGSIPPARVSTQIASLVDVMPSVLSLCGAEIPETSRGADLSPVILGEKSGIGKNKVFIDGYYYRVMGVRTLTHMYGMPMRGEKEREWVPAPEEEHMFFDVVNDPFEMDNLANTGRQEETGDYLMEELLGWHRNTPFRKF